MRFIALAVVLALLGSAAHAAPTPVDFATVSMSAPGVPRTVTDTVCVTDGNDLACDRGVYITSDSRVGIGTNQPSATLHVSGSTLIKSLDSSSFVSIGDYGYDGMKGLSIYFDPSATDSGIIAAAHYGTNWKPLLLQPAGHLSGNVGIGIAQRPSTTLHVSGTVLISNGGEACDANRSGAIRYTGGDFSFCRNGSAWETLTSLGVGGGLSDRITSGTSAVVVNIATGIVSITQLGAVASYVHPSMGYVGPGVSATGTVSGSKVATNVLKLSGATGSCATAADEGAFFYDTSRKRLQVCSLRN